jgi:hypothetical protein
MHDAWLGYCDVYALCAERTLRRSREFLDAWAPHREWSASEIVIDGDRHFRSEEAVRRSSPYMVNRASHV